MLMTIADVLSPEDVREVRTALQGMRFEDGRATAGWSARLVKDNEQAREGADPDAASGRVTDAIRSNEVFSLAVRPKAFTPLIFGRYGAGKQYGTHVDDPLIKGCSHGRLVYALYCRSCRIRRRRTRHRNGGGRGGREASRRSPRALPLDERCTASRRSPTASGLSRSGGRRAMSAIPPSASSCSTSRPPAAKYSRSTARRRITTSSPRRSANLFRMWADV